MISLNVRMILWIIVLFIILFFILIYYDSVYCIEEMKICIYLYGWGGY